MLTDSIEKVRDVFDDWARRGRAEGMERGHGPAARQAFEALAVTPTDRYLDVGCGNGYTVRWAAAVGPEVRATGIDVSPEMIERARAASTGIDNASFRAATFPDPSLADGSFDAVFSMEVFYYLPDLDAGLADVARILAPGGRFACVVDFYRENQASHSWGDDLGLSLHLLDEAGWRDAFARAGLEVTGQDRLVPPLAAGEEPTWKHEVGSLMTLGRLRG